ncbi:DUF2325 domain-containing protein [Nannocystis sp.]|uniref:DUF2325 domain-containing protein n=1 Tax=Nannocystis sp. TaxID=1962667 RepID=UPI002425B1A2|nr:DUF2325 domain-containing protein [Nannocystis sp.]MBK7830105.1 DUF2325 domain-containing protein [Nannocystis sp.]MBK9752084.1 DUF2325 domain-containing protein [Nannocystis sp.]
MSNGTENAKDDGEHTVVVVGGHGGMSSRYRDVAKKLGWSVKHYEQRIPPGLRHSIGKIGLVVVMVGMVSHALRDQVKELVADESRVKYVRTASVSALRAAIEERNG